MHPERWHGIDQNMLSNRLRALKQYLLFDNILNLFGLNLNRYGFLMAESPKILVGLFVFDDFLDDLSGRLGLFLIRGYFSDDLLDMSNDFVDLNFLYVLGVPLLFDKVW
jgi:hypothetical protein